MRNTYESTCKCTADVYNELTHTETGNNIMTNLAKATKSQKDQANKSLRMYAVQGAVLSSEVYQHKNWIFRATIEGVCCKSVVIGTRGEVLDYWFS